MTLGRKRSWFRVGTHRPKRAEVEDVAGAENSPGGDETGPGEDGPIGDENMPFYQSLDLQAEKLNLLRLVKKPLVVSLPIQALSNKVHRPFKPSTSKYHLRDSLNYAFHSVRDPSERKKVESKENTDVCEFEGVPITRLAITGAAQNAAFQHQLRLSKAHMGENVFYHKWTVWLEEKAHVKPQLQNPICTSLQLESFLKKIYRENVGFYKCSLLRPGFELEMKSSLPGGKLVQLKAVGNQHELFHDLCVLVMGGGLYKQPIQSEYNGYWWYHTILTSVPVVGLLAHKCSGYWVISLRLHPQKTFEDAAVGELLEVIKGLLLDAVLDAIRSAVLVDNDSGVYQTVFEA